MRADYQTFLGRAPAQSEVDAWMSRLAQGLTNENVAAGFLGSIEYFNASAKGKSAKADWVQSAVLDVLQRSPTISEFNTLEGDAPSSQVGRGTERTFGRAAARL